MSTVTIIGAGMMGSALAFPARENGHEVRLVGTHLDREIIEKSIETGRHPKFEKDFPALPDYTMVRTLTKLFHDMDLVVIAEGIETEEEVRALAEQGVDRIQGFALARPMPVDKMVEFYHEHPMD